jgi:hypothetical protein
MTAGPFVPSSPGTSASYATGKFGQALFTAATSAQNLAVPGNFGITSGAWTVEAWINTTSTSTLVIVGSNTTGSFWFGLSGGKLQLNGRPSGTLTGTTNINDGAWHHVAASSDGSTVTRLFVDGTQQASGTSTSVGTLWSSDGLDFIGIGQHFPGTSFGFLGSLDEVRISNSNRYTGAFTAPTAAFSTDANTVGLYHLDGDGTDSSGNGYTALPADGPLYNSGKFGTALAPVKTGLQSIQDFGAAFPVTIEYWVIANKNAATKVAFGNLASGGWVGTTGTTAHCELYGTNFNGTTNIVNGAWHHIAYTYDGTTLKQWVDGVLDGSAATTSTTKPWGTGTLGLGMFGTSASFNWSGTVDELRISNSIRYTATFTPPTSAFTWDSATSGLYHLNGNGSPAVDPSLPDSPGSGTFSGSGALALPTVYKGGAQYAQSTANTKTNTFGGLTAGTTITTANSGGASGTALTAVTATGTGSTVTAASVTGWDGATTIAAALTQGGTGSAANVSWTSPTSQSGRLSASFFVKISALPPAGGKAMIFGFGNSSELMIDSTGVAALWLGGSSSITSLATAAGAWLANRWYFVQIATSVGDASSATADDTLELRIYDTTTGAALIEDISTTVNFGAARTTSPTYYGDSTAGTAYAYTTYVDSIAASGDHPYAGAFPYVSGTRQVSPIDQYGEGQPLFDNFSQTVYGTFWMLNQSATTAITAKAAAAYQGLGARSLNANLYATTNSYQFASGVRGASSVFIRFADLADLAVNRNYIVAAGLTLQGAATTSTMQLRYLDSGSQAFIATTTPAWEANTWYCVQLAAITGTPGKIEFRLWKQTAGVWSKIFEYSNTVTSLNTNSTQALSWGRIGGATGSAIDFDYPAWDTAAPFGFPGIPLTDPTTTVTTTAALGINAQLSATAVTELTGTSGLGVNLALSAGASSNIPGAPTFTGSGSLTADGVAVLPTITTADAVVNVDLGGDAQSDFPTADFWHATFEGSDTSFSATVGSVTIDGTSAFDGLAGMAASGTTNAYVAWPAAGIKDTSRKSASVYFKIDSLPSQVISILQHGSVASVAIRPGGTIGFNAPGMAFPLGTFWSSETLVPDRWYALQFAVTNSGSGADRGELRVYDIAAETTIIEVDERGLDFGVSPAPSSWYFGRAGTTTSPITVAMDRLYATDMYRSIDFPGADSATLTGGLFHNNGASYYQDFNSLSDGDAIVVANPGSGVTIPYAVPAPNSPTALNEPSDYFAYNLGTGSGVTHEATTDSPFEGSAALRMTQVPGAPQSKVGFLTLGGGWANRSASFAAFRFDSLPTNTEPLRADDTVPFYNHIGSLQIGYDGTILYQNNAAGDSGRSPALEVGVWYAIRFATHIHEDGVNLRDVVEIRRGDDIFFYHDTGFYTHSGPFSQNIYWVGPDAFHTEAPWSMSWDKLILREDWPGAGYPGPLYPPFIADTAPTTANLTIQVTLDAFSPVDATVDFGINLDLSGEAESVGVVLEDTEFLPTPYGTVEGYIDGITIGGASSSFTMSTEFTQYASSDLNIPPVTSGSPIAAVDIAWQLAGNMRCNIPEGNYWSLQGHEAGFNLKTKEILKGRDESVYRLFDETFDKNGIPQGSVYRKWKVLDAYTSAGWYGWADENAIYSTAGRGASPAMRVGARTNIVCTIRPDTKNVLFSFGSDLSAPGFGPNNDEFGVGKWFTLQISPGDMLLQGQWRKPGVAAATNFSKTASLGALGIGPSDTAQVLIGIEWVTSTQMDVNVIVSTSAGKVALSQSMTGTGFDSYAAQWQHSGPIRALYQHTVPRAQMALASFAGQSYETKVPFQSRLPSMGIDVTAPFVAFTGSIWNYLTQICIARQVDIRNDDGTILLTPMLDVTRQSYVWEPVITPSFALGMDNVARKIEIVENIAEWRPLGTVYDSQKVENDTFSASPGQSVTFNVTVDSAASLIYTPHRSAESPPMTRPPMPSGISKSSATRASTSTARTPFKARSVMCRITPSQRRNGSRTAAPFRSSRSTR